MREPDNGKRVLIFCGNDEPEELGGQICADLFESVGWTVRFAGGGVPDDEVLQMIGEIRPGSARDVRHVAQRRAGRAPTDRLSPRRQ